MKCFNSIIHRNPEGRRVDHGILSHSDVLKLLPCLVVLASSFLCCRSEIWEEVNPRSVMSDVFKSSSCIHHPLMVAEVVKPDDHGVRGSGCLRTQDPMCPFQLDAARVGV